MPARKKVKTLTEEETKDWKSLNADNVEQLYVEKETKVEIKHLSPTVSIAPTRENEREVLVSIKFHAPSLANDDLQDIVVQVLADAKEDVLLAFQGAVKQEQKFLDATRR